jgi:anti-sigma B factor antagonist
MELLTVERATGIRLEGELDMSTAPALEEALRTAVDEGGAILIDLSELTFMDSTGIGAFIKAAVALNERGCIILHGEQDRVRRVLDLARLDGSVPNLHRVSHNGQRPESSAVDRATAKPSFA